jgi:hypothetical protein
VRRSNGCRGLTARDSPRHQRPVVVATGVAHRFENFNELAVWVLFYSPEGGEGRGA